MRNGKYNIKEWHPRNPETKPPDAEDEKEASSKPLLRGKFRDAVRDHCHITGKFQGAAHNVCNQSYFRINHNLRGYDAHHLMQEIAAIDANLKCIPNNMEKYISFSLGKLRFIHSFQFLLSSLDSLVSSNKPVAFEIINHFETDPAKRSLILRKGVYPYEYVDSFERFNETSLPPKEAFYSKLNKFDISDEDYEHAKKVWKAFECEDLGTYHDLYLLSDTLLLADVFETFRKTCLKNYGLDPAHYYTSPGLSLDALVKSTPMKRELFTDYNMYLFVEKGMRGGISTEMQRYCKANNPYLHDYDPDKETSYILHFRWMRSMPTEKQIMSWQVKRKTGFILEVDLEYPQELHDKHNSYPLAPKQPKYRKSGIHHTNEHLQENSISAKTKPKSYSSPSETKTTTYSTIAISNFISVWA